MSEQKKSNLYSILIGIAVGLPMSIMILFMMMTSFFDMQSPSYFITCITCVALPLCLTFLRKYQWNVLLMECFMVLTSFIITLVYGGYIARINTINYGDSSFFIQVFLASFLAHGVSILVCVLFDWFSRRHPIQ